MNHRAFPVAAATSILLTLPAILAWAWNTLTDITDMPPIGYRHAFAALLLAGAGLAIARGHRRLQGRVHHGH